MNRSPLFSIGNPAWLLATAFVAAMAHGAVAQNPSLRQTGERQDQSEPFGPSDALLLPRDEADSLGTDILPTKDAAPIIQAIELLSSPRFSDRRKATRELRDLGLQAHPDLRRVANGSDSESASRAIEILNRAMESDSSAIKNSAKESLEQIADSKAPLSASAKLRLKRKDGMPQILNRLGLAPRIVVGPARPAIPPAFAPQRRTNLRISVRTKDGVREMKVVKNDQTYQFRITNNGIETERPDGNGGIKKQIYQDEAELQKSDPQAHDAYRNAGGGGPKGAQFRFQIQGGPGRPINAPKP